MVSSLSRSLSVRLVAIFLLLGGLFVFGTLKAIQIVYNSDDIRGLISGHLSLHVNYVREDIGSPPRIGRAIAITRRVPVDIRILGPGVNWASDDNFPRLDQLDFGPSPAFSDEPGAWVDELKGVEFAEFERHNFLKIRQGDYDIVVSTPRIADVPGGPDLITMIIGMGLTFLLFAYMAVRWLFRPIGSIRKGAAHIGRGNFDYRISSIRHDELGELAGEINQLAGDVESMLNAKRTLLLGISHELRTPLSRMRLMLEFMEDDTIRDDFRVEIIEMERIVVSLLEAERLSGRYAQLASSPVVVGELVDNLLRHYFMRDVDRIRINVPDEPITANIDETRITLMLKNLLSNALRYSSAADGPVELSVRVDDDDLVFVVSDNGPGLSPDQAQHVGEAFYRNDPSRTRESGGAGLGLHLAVLVAKAHGGTLQLVDTASAGAKFEVRIPMA